MQPAYTAGVAGWRYSKERVTTRGQPLIHDWAKLRERPDRHNRRQPFPARQNTNNFDPSEVPFEPFSIRGVRVHLFGHLFARVWRSFEILRIVVIQPFNPM